MATIVRHIKTGSRFVLLGTGFGAYQSAKPNWFFGDLIADRESGEMALVCVSTGKGKIGWFHSNEVEVVSVDGTPIEEL